MTNTPRFLTTDVGLTELTGDQLRARVARAQMYLVHMRPVDGASVPPGQVERDHLAYLHKLEAEGRLYGYGPVEPEGELAIVAVASREDAEAIAANEPLQRAGVRECTVQGHTMNEGVACYVARSMAKRAERLVTPFDPTRTTVDDSLETLQGHAAGVPLHLIYLEPTGKPRPADDAQTGYDHFVWLRTNEMQALLMSCGPLEPPQPLAQGIWGGGLGVVAVSRDEAEQIAGVEPSGREGYRKLTVHSWTMDYGLAAPIAKAIVTLNGLPE